MNNVLHNNNFNKRLCALLIGLLLGTIIINNSSAELIFYINIADKYNRMIYKNIDINVYKYDAYLLLNELRNSLIIILLNNIFYSYIIEYILFCISGAFLGMAVGGYTIIYGTAGIIKSFFMIQNFVFYIFVLLISVKLRNKKLKMLLTVIFANILHIIFETIFTKIM